MTLTISSAALPVATPTVSDLCHWAVLLDDVFARPIETPAAGTVDPRPLPASLEGVAQWVTPRERAALREVTARYQGTDPGNSPVFYTVCRLSSRDFGSLPTMAAVGEWRNRIATALGMAEADVERLTLTAFTDHLLELPYVRSEARRPPPTTVSGQPPIHLLPQLPAVDGRLVRGDLWRVSRLLHAVGVQIELTVRTFESWMASERTAEEANELEEDEGETRRPRADILARVISTHLAALAEYMPEALAAVDAVRNELILARSGWESKVLPATDAGTAVLEYGRVVVGRFDRVIRRAGRLGTGSGEGYRPPGELLTYADRVAGYAALYEDLFADLPPIRQVLAVVAREVTAAADARERRVQALRPVWDKRARSLTYAGRLVRQYTGKEGENQEAVLDAFEAKGWPPSVELSELADKLRDTVYDLNSDLAPGTIEFARDGTGCGVLWQTAGPKRKGRRKTRKTSDVR
jgi:hypothetical protein